MRSIIWAALVAAMGTAYARNARADMIHLDFDLNAAGGAIAPGQRIDDEYAAWGVIIDAVNNVKSHHIGVAFNSEVPTGGDPDLRTPGYGLNNNVHHYRNVLIIAENVRDTAAPIGLIDDPDDEAGGGMIRFRFDEARRGGHISLLDIEEHGSEVQLWLDGTGQMVLPIGALGDNSLQMLDLGDEVAYDEIAVHLTGSGAVVDVLSLPEPTTAVLLSAALLLAGRRRRA
jgi:hypothetical protein